MSYQATPDDGTLEQEFCELVDESDAHDVQTVMHMTAEEVKKVIREKGLNEELREKLGELFAMQDQRSGQDYKESVADTESLAMKLLKQTESDERRNEEKAIVEDAYGHQVEVMNLARKGEKNQYDKMEKNMRKKDDQRGIDEAYRTLNR